MLKPKMVSGYIEAGQVAAALMTKSGNIYTGICIDTACSLGMCAERNAIAHMLTCGESEIRKLAVVMSDGTMSLPCGACGYSGCVVAVVCIVRYFIIKSRDKKEGLFTESV